MVCTAKSKRRQVCLQLAVLTPIDILLVSGWNLKAASVSKWPCLFVICLFVICLFVIGHRVVCMVLRYV